MKRNPFERLGTKGIEMLRLHKWFNFFDWKKLKLKVLKPLFVPEGDDNSYSFENSKELKPELKVQKKKLLNRDDI